VAVAKERHLFEVARDTAVTRFIRTIEEATAANLFPAGYLAAHDDLRNAFGNDEKAARDHFHRHGAAEKRRQLTREFFEWKRDAAAQRERFDRFRSSLADNGRAAKQFPIQYGNVVESVDTYMAESSNALPQPFVETMRNNPEKLFADIGAGIRSLVSENCINVEVYQSLTTDVVIEPNSKLPFQDASLDGIGCFAVLEHVREPWKMASEIARVVKPGGRIFIDWPFLQPMHGFPSHYYNATREGVRALFEADFEINSLTAGSFQGPDHAIHWLLSEWARSIPSAELREQFLSQRVSDLIAAAPEQVPWKAYVAALDETKRSDLAAGHFLLATRRSGGALAIRSFFRRMRARSEHPLKGRVIDSPVHLFWARRIAEWAKNLCAAKP
jgi:SAM-dependent methyltransferase